MIKEITIISKTGIPQQDKKDFPYPILVSLSIAMVPIIIIHMAVNKNIIKDAIIALPKAKQVMPIIKNK